MTLLFRFAQTAKAMKFDFQTGVLMSLLKVAEKVSTFKGRIKALIAQGVQDADDMTVVVMEDPE